MSSTPARRPEPGRGSVRGGSRLAQVVVALVLTVISVLLMITTHRLRLDVGVVELPVGLAFGAAFQVLVCVFLVAAGGSRLPVLVVGIAWGVLALPFLGSGAGGGLLMPAVLGEQVQYSGWIVQGLGVGIPFVVAGIITVGRVRALQRLAPPAASGKG